MKQRFFRRFGVLVIAVVLAGCARPTGDPPAANVETPAVAASAVAQLQKTWTLINFGAPW